MRKELRGRGIGTAMMNDSFGSLPARDAILVLHGAPGYYTPFGYVDVFDTSEVSFKRMEW